MKRRVFPKSTLDALVTSRVIDLFSKKEWTIHPESDGNLSLFNRFCLMLEGLNSTEQNLILEVSESYLTINFSRYVYYLEKVLDSALKTDGNDAFSKLYFSALIAPEDRGKSKSGILLACMCKANELFYSPIFEDKKVVHLDNASKCIDKINKSPISLLVLVDDFIGTGETAQHALEDLLKQDIDIKKIIVISIVAQQEGIMRIQSLGIKIYAAIQREKGITDKFSTEEAARRLQIMELIELKRKVKSEFRFGYGRSEALVTMGRTPNNTFPIFWLEENKFVSPFPRS